MYVSMKFIYCTEMYVTCVYSWLCCNGAGYLDEQSYWIGYPEISNWTRACLSQTRPLALHFLSSNEDNLEYLEVGCLIEHLRCVKNML